MKSTLLSPPIEIDLGDNPGKVRIESFEDLDTWVMKENVAWTGALGNLRNLKGAVYEPAFNQQLAPIQRLLKSVNQARERQARGEDWEQVLRESVSQHFNDFVPSNLNPLKPKSLHSKSAAGRRVLAAATAGQRSASGMLAWEIGFPVPVTAPSGSPLELMPFTEGVVVALRDNFKLAPDMTELRDSLQNLVAEWQERVADQRTHYENELKQARAAEEQFERRHFRVSGLALAGLRRFRDSHRTELKNHNEEMSTIRATFNEQMKLRGPVSYWTSKRWGHVGAALFFAILFVLAAGGAVYAVYYHAAPTMDVMIAAANPTSPLEGASPPSAYMLHLKLLVEIGIPAFFGFWILRVVSRLFHMNIVAMADAGERVTMAKTYLALFDEKKLAEADRILILSALFRPTSQTPDESPPPNWFDLLMQRIKPQ